MKIRNYTSLVMLALLPVAATACASIILLAGLRFRKSDFEEVLFQSIAILVIYSLLLFAASVARRTPLLFLIAAVASSAALAATLWGIAEEFQRRNRHWSEASAYTPGSHWDYLIAVYGWLIGATACFVGLVLSARLHKRYRFASHITVVALLGLAAIIGLWLPGPTPIGMSEHVAGRALLFLGCAAGLGLFVIPVLARATQFENRRMLVMEFGNLTLRCPRCDTLQTVPAGESECVQCRLRLEVNVRENLCDTCGYALYKLESMACPECGTPISGKKPRTFTGKAAPVRD